jgi:DNA-binding beta-propeller fold protein YncE
VFPVGRSPQYVVFDGTYMWVTNFSSDTVTARRATDGFRLGTFAVGSQPSGVTFDGANIWVAKLWRCHGNETARERRG